MRNKTGLVLSALSLMLCVATCALWTRSYWKDDCFFVGDGSRYWYAFISERGAIALGWCFSDGFYHSDFLPATFPSEPPPAVRLPSHWSSERRTYPTGTGGNLYVNLARNWQFAGFGRSHHGGRQYLLIPQWAVVLSLVAPAWFLLPRIAKPRIAGNCAECGYDLRATPDRCPECGTVPDAANDISTSV